ncbi:MAG: hydantoinase/oxoprolinase family protein, partial [Armatimonadetes bacterium]|nr:hydantoinase/oxoprolinase family protein [Armatimonadota bacterium]
EPLVAREFEVARADRFKKGSGLPIRVPAVELIEIGAGGGSIAWIDQFHLLRVGPESAGAEPGPACYGRGGTRPTVTDADLILGYLSPDYFLGGRMPLDVAGAERALRDVAEPLGLSITEAAWTIHQVVNENMAAAARIHGAERGVDLRGAPMYAFGGAGPVHACRVAELLEIAEIVLPYAAGVGSTVGLLAAPLAFDLARSAPGLADAMDWHEAAAILRGLEGQGRRLLVDAETPAQEVRVLRFGDMRLRGQAHALMVPLPDDGLDPKQVEEIFHRVYRASYHRMPPRVPIEITTWRVRVEGARPSVRVQAAAEPGDPRKGERRVYLPEAGTYVPTPVYSRYRLAPGARVAGPAIIEERESTVVIAPSGEAEVDAHFNLVLRVGSRKAAGDA